MQIDTYTSVFPSLPSESKIGNIVYIYVCYIVFIFEAKFYKSIQHIPATQNLNTRGVN